MYSYVQGQRDALAAAFVNDAKAPTDKVIQTAKGAIEEAVALLPTSNGRPVVALDKDQAITTALKPLAAAVADAYAQLKARDTEIERLKTTADKARQDNETALTNLRGEVAKSEARTAAEKAQVDTKAADYAKQLADNAQQTSTQIKALSDAVAAAQTTISAKDKEIEDLKKIPGPLLARLKQYRLNAKENIVRQADGAITRVTGDGYCYINLGAGDHIPAGITFEVYDKTKGVPALGNGLADETELAAARARIAASKIGAKVQENAGYETELPKGKGSIEVVSVGPGHTSQCRIVSTDKNRPLTEGDIIANLVYDPNTKLNFFVYGNFDLANNGVGSAQDTLVIKRLIEQWGGTVVNEIGVSTDFVVMGVETKPLNLSEEEKNNPEMVAKAEAVEKIRTAYKDVIARPTSTASRS